MCPTVQNTTQGSLSVLLLNILNFLILGFPGGSEAKASACNAGDLDSVPGLGRSPGEGNGNPLQYSCLENPMDGGACWATVHGLAKSRTRLSDFTHSHGFMRKGKNSWLSTIGKITIIIAHQAFD